MQWVKKLTAAVWVAVEARIQSPAQCSELKLSCVAAAVAWIQTLAQELPYAVGATLKKKKISIFIAD